MSESKDEGQGKAEGLPPAPLVMMKGPAPGGSTTNTAAVAMTTAGSGAAVIWIFQCLAEGRLVTPSTETALFVAAALLPLMHTLRNGINALLGRWFGVEPTNG